MEAILFVLSLTVVIHYILKVISCCLGNSINVPLPVLHYFDISFTNTYISTPAIMYQVYFWAIHFEIINLITYG